MCDNCKNDISRPSNSSIAYGVYESGGVVKAEVTDTAFDAMHVITRLCEKADMKTISLEGIWENTLLENSYRGKAKVNHADGDKFVEDIGLLVARLLKSIIEHLTERFLQCFLMHEFWLQPLNIIVPRRVSTLTRFLRLKRFLRSALVVSNQ